VGGANEIQDHRARCQPHLLRLRMLVRSEAGMPEPLQVVADIAEATGAILARAEAADRAARAATQANRAGSMAGMFVRVRLNRLATAAEDAVAAARAEDFARMRHHLRRFEALTSAMWTVQDEVYRPRPARRPGPRLARPAS
jgi:hypothetical protein